MKKWKHWKVECGQVRGLPKAGREAKDSTAKAVSILHERDPLPSRPVAPRDLAASLRLC